MIRSYAWIALEGLASSVKTRKGKRQNSLSSDVPPVNVYQDALARVCSNAGSATNDSVIITRYLEEIPETTRKWYRK